MSVMSRPKPVNVADLLNRLAVPAERIRLEPRPGWATEADVIQHKMCELIDGTLVEKAMGYYESWLGVILIGHLERYLDKHDLGIALESAGMIRVASGQIRLPDVS